MSPERDTSEDSDLTVSARGSVDAALRATSGDGRTASDAAGRSASNS